MAVWVVGCFVTPFYKAKRAYVGIAWFFMVDSLHSKQAGKVGRRKGIAISVVSRSLRSSFEN